MTGGGGYVGSSLCSKLAERGYTVTTFDLRYPMEDQTDDIHRIKVFSFTCRASNPGSLGSRLSHVMSTN